MTSQYEDTIFDAFFEPIQPSSAHRQILLGLLGEEYRDSFNRWNNGQSAPSKKTLVEHAGYLGVLYSSPANPRQNPKERLAWARENFIRLVKNGRRTTRSSCLLCVIPPIGPKR